MEEKLTTEENQIIDGLASALAASGPGYDAEKSKVVAEVVYHALIGQGIPESKLQEKMEKTCLVKDCGLDSLDFINVVLEVEDRLKIFIDDQRLNLKKGQISLLEVMQVGYEVKYSGN